MRKPGGGAKPACASADDHGINLLMGQKSLPHAAGWSGIHLASRHEGYYNPTVRSNNFLTWINPADPALWALVELSI
jgi:hypothetical protein